MFCLDYYPNHKYDESVDQLKITYRPADRTLEDFLQTYQNKTIIIDVNNHFQDLDAELLKGLYEKYRNLKVIFDFNNKEYYIRAIEQSIPFFFSNFITTIDELNGLINYHPTDMYICEQLCFSLDKVSNLLHHNNIKVRVFPNICQSSFADTPSIKTFFIRPEDISTYSTFVDVFELISDEAREQIIHKIYKQKKWMGKINEIIPSFKDDIDNYYFLDTFGMIRTQCGKRCMYKPDSCKICDRFIELTKTFKDNNIIVRKKKAD